MKQDVRAVRSTTTIYGRAVAVALTLGLFSACGVDIRPEPIAQSGVTPEAAARGRALMAEMIHAHGGVEAWKAHTNVAIELSDTWHSAWRRALAMPWSHNGQRMRLDIRIADHAARFTFLDGPGEGEVWGLVGDRSWKQPKGEPVEDDDGVAFWVRSFTYFVEMPFRLPEAEIIAYAGQETVAGKVYDRVFLTWRAPEPQDDIDQWIAYIDPETKRLVWAAYTLRELAIVPKGAMRFQGHQDVGGVMLPHDLASFRNPQSDSQNHSIQVFSITFDVERPPGYFEPWKAAGTAAR